MKALNLKGLGYRNSPTLFRTVPSPTPYSLLFPKTGGSQPHPKVQSLLSQEPVKLRTSNLAETFTESQGPSEQQPIKILEKSERGHIQGLPKILLGTSNYLKKRVKLRTSNFVRIFTVSVGRKAH